MGKASISVVKGKGSMAHNNRDFVTDNVDKSRIKDNVTYVSIPLFDAYKNCFEQVIQEYNANQKRADRRIDGVQGYMEQVRTSKNGEKLFYETVIQVGNMLDSHVGTEQGEVCKQVLDKYMNDFQNNNPNLYVFNAVLHMDEQTPHLHIDYIPLADGYQKGLQVRNSLDRAFKQQGIEGKSNKYENSTIAWQNSQKDCIESIMNRYGLERIEETGLHREHKDVEHYKATVEYIQNKVNAIPDTIEATPIPLVKGKVAVKEDELERLHERAKLSVTHEESAKKLLSGIKAEVKQSNEYVLQHNLSAMRNLDEAQKVNEIANAKYKEAKDMKSKYVELYKQQEDLNAISQRLYASCQKQKETIEEQKLIIDSQRNEITSLKAQIGDLKASIEEKIQKTIEPLKEQIEALKTKARNVAIGEATLMRAVRYVKERFSGQASEMILDATLRVGDRYLKEDGYEDLINTNAGIPKAIKERINGELFFQKGNEGIGVYSEKGILIAECESFKEARENFPKCHIKNEQNRNTPNR